MIWTIIVFAILVISMFIAMCFDNDHPILWSAGVIMAFISWFAALFICCMIIGANVCHDRRLEALRAEREALVYQVDHNLYLGDAVGKFNSELINAQLGHEDPWTNWFYGSYWTEVDPIEFND